ncbi:AHH domain-containing protein [Archangium violaceum]
MNSVKPYYNVGHHILPCEVFKPREKGKKTGGAFTDEQHEILKRTTYNVNNGKNIIFLPGFSTGLITQWGIKKQQEKNPLFDWKSIKDTEEGKSWMEEWSESAQKKLDRYGAVHQLPCHIDFHSDYTLKVCTDMDKVAKELKHQADNLCEDWKPPESIPQTIIDIQNDYWNYIVRWGEKNPLKSVNFMEKLSDEATDTAPRKRRKVV